MTRLLIVLVVFTCVISGSAIWMARGLKPKTPAGALLCGIAIGASLCGLILVGSALAAQ